MRKHFLLTLIAFAVAWVGKAQNNVPAFENFTSADGLAQNDVHAMHQDAQGYIWFGTTNGLSRYDGYTFQTYKNNPDNANSLLDNHIVSITSDSKRNLWILTMKGVNKLHLPTGQFTHYPSKKNKDCKYLGAIDAEISRIWADSKDRIWVHCYCEKGNVMYLASSESQFKLVNCTFPWLPNKTSKNQGASGNFWEDDKGEVYFGFAHNDLKTHTTENLLHNPAIKDTTDIIGITPEEHQQYKQQPLQATDFIAYIGANATAIDREGNIWTGDQAGKVACFSPKTKRLYFYPQWVEEGKNIRLAKHNSYATIKALHIDKQKNLLYIGLYGTGDVIVVDLEAEHAENARHTPDRFGRVVRYGFAKKEVWYHNPSNPKSFRGYGSCIGIFTDKSGCVWISTTGNGVYKYAPYRQKFETFAAIPRDTNTLRNNDILCFLRTKQDKLFVGTAMGLHEYIATENRFRYCPLYFTRDGRQAEVRRVSALAEDSKGNLLVGTWGLGTFKYNPQTRKSYCLKYYKDKEEFNQPMTWVSALYYDESEDKVWEFDWGSGKGYIDLKTEKALAYHDYAQAQAKAGKPIPKEKSQYWALSRSYLRTTEGKFWVGHDREERFELFNPTNFHHEHFFFPKNHPDSLKSTTILAMKLDSKGRIWAGTANGLSLLNPEKMTWKTYSTKHGIPNENINGILEDTQGYLWLLTGRGLAKFDTQKERVLLVLTTHDGLPNDELTMGYQDAKNNFYVGTTKGFVRFSPEKIAFNTYKPRVLLTHIEVNERSLNADSLMVLGKKCYFSRFDNDIEFTLASTDYNLPTQNKFRVKLEGYNQHWVLHGTRNIITYTNLPAGYYTLRVQASNQDGVWSDEVVLLQFSILPAWYETWWARILFILLFVGLVALAFRQRIRYLEAQKLKLQAEVDKQTIDILEKNEELHQQNEEILQQRDNLESINEELKQQQEEIQAINDELAEKNKEITESIDAALMVQDAILPTSIEFAETFGKENYFILYKPHQGKISGDFYFLESKRVKQSDKKYSNCVFLVCADCTGHSVQGAFMAMLGNQILHSIVINMELHDPAKILRRLHAEVRKTLHFKDTHINNGMDLSLIVLHKATSNRTDRLEVNKIEFAGAKNNVYYVIENEDLVVNELKADRKGIGGQDLYENEGIREFQTHTLTFEKTQNLTLYLCSDGYQDQLGGKKNKVYGPKKMREAILSQAHESLENQRDFLEKEHQAWRYEGKEIQTDDITLMAVRLKALKP